jgi:hypothetical protein
MIYSQQGDVLFKKIASIPADAKESDEKVIMHGESGHAHRVARNAAAAVLIVGAMRYLRVDADTPIEHEEHKTIILPPGTYRIDQVREYSHFDEEARYVID